MVDHYEEKLRADAAAADAAAAADSVPLVREIFTFAKNRVRQAIRRRMETYWAIIQDHPVANEPCPSYQRYTELMPAIMALLAASLPSIEYQMLVMLRGHIDTVVAGIFNELDGNDTEDTLDTDDDYCDDDDDDGDDNCTGNVDTTTGQTIKVPSGSSVFISYDDDTETEYEDDDTETELTTEYEDCGDDDDDDTDVE